MSEEYPSAILRSYDAVEDLSSSEERAGFIKGSTTLYTFIDLYSYTSTGNLRQFFQCQAGEADFKWQEEFGGIVRIKAPFGVRPILEALFFHNDWVI